MVEYNHTSHEDKANKLALQVKYLNDLLDNMNELFYTYDTEGILTFINKKSIDILGYEQHEMIGKFVWDFVHPSNKKALIDEVRNRFKKGKRDIYLTKILHKNGTVRILRINVASIMENKTIIGEVALAEDVTEARQNEKALREANIILEKTKSELLKVNKNLLQVEEELRKQLEEAEQNKEALFKAHSQLENIMDFLPDPTFVINYEGKVTIWNKAMEDLTGVKARNMLGRDNREYSVLFYGNRRPMLIDYAAGLVDMDSAKSCYDIFSQSENRVYADQFVPQIGMNGTYVSGRAAPLYNDSRQIIGAIETIRDLSERIKSIKELKDSEEKYRNIIESIEDGYFEVNKFGYFTFVNSFLHKTVGYDYEEIIGMSFQFLMDEDNTKKIKRAFAQVYETGEPLRAFDWYVLKKDGSALSVETTILPVKRNDEVTGFRGLVRDISERKKAVEQLIYMNIHDPLTGVYNRLYFEQQMQTMQNNDCLPVGLIVSDVDGLKLINDTLGHAQGDETLRKVARIFQSCFRKEDVVARVGGDEFAVLIDSASTEIVTNAIERIRKAIDKFNLDADIPISMSIGSAIRNSLTITMDEIFKEADNNMYREKLHSRQSARSAIVQTLTKALNARDYITEGHAERIQDLVAKIARKLNMDERAIFDLRLFAHFHDIGKVGVPDAILLKNGKLTADEYRIMQRHCEIGHRIALSAPEMVIISDWILKHHEWWNGQGYPLGLQKEEIPMECRILAVADAYDAMTSIRPYRQAMTHEEAVAELKKYSGIQFDPEIVKVFLELDINNQPVDNENAR